MTYLIDPYRFDQPTVAATQWRVWVGGCSESASSSASDQNIRITTVEMATSPGGSDIAPTGTATSSPTVASVANLFDGNSTTAASTTEGDRFWAQVTFASPVLLSEVRVGVGAAFGTNGPPQVIIVMQRNSGLAAWDVVHVSTGLLWTASEVKTLSIAPLVRRKGIASALAWRIRWAAGLTGSVWRASFDGVTNNAGQAFSQASGAFTQIARRAFDGDPATTWQTTSGIERRLGQVIATPTNAVPATLTLTGSPAGGSALLWTPTNPGVEWSDDMETWNLRASPVFVSWTAPPQVTQVVAI